ncbi:MAG TPA: cell division protein FtsZ [Bauldia sp.]|nr:cell division protein FtsZ [Bauldia sp.]
MTLNLKMPEIKELKPKITVFGVGGAGGNAVNNMIRSGLMGCEFVVANTDSQALHSSKAERLIQMGVAVTEGLGAGSQPEVGRAAAEEAIAEITDHLAGSHMVFVTAGMGGGTGTGAAPIIARTAREQGILTVGVVTKPFQFEGIRRMRVADAGIKELEACVDTLIVIPNQNLFRIANEKTTFADAFAMADQVLYSGVACITDLMVKEGLINLDFADVRSVMREMGKAMMGTGEASGERRATQAAEAAIANPLLDETSMRGARGLLISITGGKDLTLFEVDEAATRIREEVDPDANIILGATFEEALEGVIRVSVVATGINASSEGRETAPLDARAAAEISQRLRGMTAAVNAAPAKPAPAPMPRRAPIPMQPRPAAPMPQPQPAPMMPPAAQDPSLAAFDTDPSHYGMEATPEEMMDDEADAEAPFMAPVAETPVRIPRVEDFPPVVQRQIEARQQPQRPVHEDRGPMSLLRRLASVGLGRAQEEPAPSAEREPARVQRPAQKPAQAQQRQIPPQPRAQQPQSRHPSKDAMYRPAEGNLDPHGRQPAPRPVEDELEIPAFLRRQAN